MAPAERVPPPLLGAAEYESRRRACTPARAHPRDTARFDAAFRAYIRRWAYKHPTRRTSSLHGGRARGRLSCSGALVYERRRRPGVDSVRTRTDSAGPARSSISRALARSRCPSTPLSYATATESERLPVEMVLGTATPTSAKFRPRREGRDRSRAEFPDGGGQHTWQKPQ